MSHDMTRLDNAHFAALNAKAAAENAVSHLHDLGSKSPEGIDILVDRATGSLLKTIEAATAALLTLAD